MYATFIKVIFLWDIKYHNGHAEIFDFHFSARCNLYVSSNFFPKDEDDNYNSSNNSHNNSNNNIMNITYL